MNARVLELLKNPKNIQSEDLSLLKEEINSFPYLQNIRALHLIGVHLYEPENYQKELSTTAAYTTDKKILYQLINGKIEAKKPVEEIQQEKFLKPQQQAENQNIQPEIVVAEPEQIEEKPEKHDYEAAAVGLIPPKPEIKHVFVEGERNRILFPGEENFLEEEHNDIIDLESTLESGVIVTQKMPKAIVEENIQLENSEKKNDEDAKHLQDSAPKETASEKEYSADIDNGIVAEEPAKSESQPKLNSADLNRNRILFKGEENFLNEPNHEVIDRESTLESGVIVTTNTPKAIVEENIQIENSEKDVSENVSSFEEKAEEISVNNGSGIFNEIIEDAEESNISDKNESVNSDFKEPVQLNAETIIDEEKIESTPEEEKILDESELSFHATPDFLPEIQVQANEETTPQSQPQKSSTNKHEEEMRRLIAQVEERMKLKKAEQKAEKKEKTVEKPAETEDQDHSQTSFSESHDFEVQKPESKVVEEIKGNPSEKTENIQAEKEVLEETQKPEVSEETSDSGWKPMSFETSLPDSLLNQNKKVGEKPETAISENVVKEEIEAVEKPLEETKTVEIVPEQKEEKKAEETSEENLPEEKMDEKAATENVQPGVMNVSFFGSDISKFDGKPKAEKTEKEIEIPSPKAEVKTDASNVPGFINTWQSWLKIDRSEEIIKEKAIQKTKVIESFIENNPKISQLKDEVTFTVKEKNDDISHLMTETLANLYIEQKLYTKAVKSFHILAEKHPDKKSYFEDKIQEIKDLRNKN